MSAVCVCCLRRVCFTVCVVRLGVASATCVLAGRSEAGDCTGVLVFTVGNVLRPSAEIRHLLQSADCGVAVRWNPYLPGHH